MTLMNCGMNWEKLAEYAAGRLDARDRAEVEQHLRACPACADAVQGQRAVWEELENWEAPPVSADFDAKLYGRIRAEATRKERFWGRFLPIGLRRGLPIAAAASLAIAAGLLMQRPPTPEIPRAQSLQIEPLTPDQAEHALEDLEMLQELNGLIRPDPDARM